MLRVLLLVLVLAYTAYVEANDAADAIPDWPAFSDDSPQGV